MWALSFLLAATAAALIAALALALPAPSFTRRRRIAAIFLGVAAGLLVGVFMADVNPPRYDWFGFYAMGQLAAGGLGGLAGGAAVALLARRRSGPSKAGRPRWQAIVPAVALGLLLAGFGAHRYVNPTRAPAYLMPELADAVVYPKRLAEGMTMESIRAALGEPTLVARDEDYSRWFYAVRRSGWSRAGSIRAPLLQITIDPTDHVQSWRFVHPLSGEPLKLREGRLQATRWLNGLCGSGEGPRIDLEERLIPGVTTSDEVLATFGPAALPPWANDLWPAIFSRPLPDGGQLISFPVDHPSAMYLPVMNIELSFDGGDRMQVWSFSGSC